jgi:RNase P protein component
MRYDKQANSGFNSAALFAIQGNQKQKPRIGIPIRKTTTFKKSVSRFIKAPR